MHEQNRCEDLVGVGGWRNLLQCRITRAVHTDQIEKIALDGRVVLCTRPTHHSTHVRYAGNRNGTSIRVSFEGSTRKRCVSAVARADYANALRIDASVRSEEANAVGEIALHLA